MYDYGQQHAMLWLSVRFGTPKQQMLLRIQLLFGDECRGEGMIHVEGVASCTAVPL